MAKVAAALILVAVASCSSDDEDRRKQQEKCDSIAGEIRRAASTRGIPTQGACNAGASDLAQACEALRKCNEELDQM